MDTVISTLRYGSKPISNAYNYILLCILILIIISIAIVIFDCKINNEHRFSPINWLHINWLPINWLPNKINVKKHKKVKMSPYIGPNIEYQHIPVYQSLDYAEKGQVMVRFRTPLYTQIKTQTHITDIQHPETKITIVVE